MTLLALPAATKRKSVQLQAFVIWNPTTASRETDLDTGGKIIYNQPVTIDSKQFNKKGLTCWSFIGRWSSEYPREFQRHPASEWK